MTRMKKLMLSGALSTAALGIVFAGSTYAAGQYGNGNSGNGTELHQNQLTDAEKEAREAEMETRITAAFDTAETAGKITAEQKTKLLELHEAVHAAMQSGDHTAGEAAMKEMHDWMTVNSIDSSVMPTPPEGGRGPGNGNHDGNGRHNHGAETSSESN